MDLYSRVTDLWFNNSVLPNNTTPALPVITALKKICNHPELFFTGKNEFLCDDLKNFTRDPNAKDFTKKAYCGKISIVQTLMRNLKKTDEKLVLISYYTQTLDLLEIVCKTEYLQFLRLDGSTTSNARSKIIELFNSIDDKNS